MLTKTDLKIEKVRKFFKEIDLKKISLLVKLNKFAAINA